MIFRVPLNGSSAHRDACQLDNNNVIAVELKKPYSTKFLKHRQFLMLKLSHIYRDKDISFLTWNAIENISYVKPFIPEWKQSGALNAK